MTWTPISLVDLEALVARDLADCSADLRSFFADTALSPVKWQQSPWGDEGGGFWAAAVCEGRVLWYNDIEDGFNVSAFTAWGRIPEEEYWCNQDSLKHALVRLMAVR